MATLPSMTENRLRPEHFERAPQPTSAINVGEVERWLSLLGGGALALYGLQRGSLGGLALAVAGGCLAYRGLTGHCSVYGSLGLSTAQRGPATVIPAGQGVKVDQTITIQHNPEELYRYWRNLENLPRF